jgi:hypothetical protein
VVAFAALVPYLMRFPLDRVARWIAPSGGAPPPSPDDVGELVAAIDGWLARARPLVRSGCVVRGLTLYRFLRRAGADVSLRFGVGVMDGQIAGHCWIMYRGEPLAERRDPRGLFVETWATA